jgi:hypothetical protein
MEHRNSVACLRYYRNRETPLPKVSKSLNPPLCNALAHSSSTAPISPFPLLAFLPSFSRLSRFRTLPTPRLSMPAERSLSAVVGASLPSVAHSLLASVPVPFAAVMTGFSS